MNFLEALRYCKETGRAITRERYSEESKQTVQWYLTDKDILVCQNYDRAPELKSIGKDYWTDEWVGYPGNYKKWTDINKEKIDRFKELQLELGPFLNKLDEYNKLKEELRNNNI